MTDRENQQRLDQVAMKYLQAVEAEDFDTIDALLMQAAADADLAAMLHGLNVELLAEREARDRDNVEAAILQEIERHVPSAEVVHPDAGPLTVGEVANHLRKHPPPGLTADDLKLNDQLLKSAEVVPAELGLSQVLGWGEQFGSAPAVYWRAFRQAALKLRMQRESDAQYQMAARPTKPKPPEQQP